MTTSFQIDQNGPEYGEHEGRWQSIAKNGNSCDLETFPTAFLPLLESSIAELIAKHPAAECFPFCALLNHAASFESSYWQERALDRIEEMNLSDECVNVLRLLSRNGLNQGIRHRAAGLLRHAGR